MGSFAPKFLNLADNYPEDPVALEALRQAIQIVVSTDSGALKTWDFNESDFVHRSADRSAERAVELVLRDHLLSADIGPIIDRMRYGYRMAFDEGLTTILEKNPHDEMKGLACLALGQFLNDRLRMVRLAEDRPELAECCEIVFGNEYLPQLQRMEQTGLAERIEALFEQATQYEDVKTRAGGTVAEHANRALYELRHLAVGLMAPDIDGVDQDGKKLKLSDYRGQIVMLYFWSEF